MRLRVMLLGCAADGPADQQLARPEVSPAAVTQPGLHLPGEGGQQLASVDSPHLHTARILQRKFK